MSIADTDPEPRPFWIGVGLAALATIGWLWSVGHFSDDYSYLHTQGTKESVWEALALSGSFVSLPLEQYTHVFFLYFADLESDWVPIALKTVYVITALYMCARFFALFLPPALGVVTAFAFIYFPTHDATVFWYFSQYLMLTVAFYMYAYVRLTAGHRGVAVVWATAASFISYGSPAPALAMTWLAWRKLGRGPAILLLAPNLAYAVYYLVTQQVLGLGVDRLDASGPATVARQFVLQIATFADATLGPSMWLKVWGALGELTVVTALLTLFGVVVLVRTLPIETARRRFVLDKDLLLALVAMTVLAFGMLALTGRYPNIAFNLGNRTNIFGTALLAYLLMWAWARWRPAGALLVMLVFATTGLSNHWRHWSGVQDQAVQELRSTLGTHPDIDTLYVAGMQYSRLGILDHIELFSEDWVVTSITELATGGRVRARPLNRNVELGDDERLVDVRYGDRFALPETLVVHDFHAGEVRRIRRASLPTYLETLPPVRRHWLQAVDSPWLRGWILRLMPRLEYVFAS